MSRSLTNFLLFEDLFDNLSTTNQTLNTLATQIFRPNVKVIQENCNTKLGRRIDVSPNINGLVKISFNGTLNGDRTIPDSDRISKEEIDEWLASSIYTTYVRDLHNCTSLGGICASCYAATFNAPAPAVGSFVQVQNQYTLHSDYHLTSDLVDTYGITTDSSLYDFLIVYLDNKVLTGDDYVFNGGSLTLSEYPELGQYLSINAVIASNKPFMSYLSNTFSGDLLGIQSIPTQPTTLPLGVIDRGISEGQILQLTNQLEKLPTVDQIHLDYCSNLHNKVEKALLLISLFSLHNDIQT